MNSSLLSLLHLTDPTLPIGGFSHSAGLETYVQEGVVKDTGTARQFIINMLSHNLHYTDAAFVSLSYDAALTKNLSDLMELDQECSAVKLPREMRQASEKLGIRLLKIFEPLIDSPLLTQIRQKITEKQITAHYCVMFGVISALLKIPKTESLQGFYYNAAVGMITNSVKLIPLGQQDGQKILFGIQELICELAEASLIPDKSLIGVCCSGFDIRSMQHEQLYTRLYMS